MFFLPFFLILSIPNSNTCFFNHQPHLMGIFQDIYRKLVFFVGDIKKLNSFPWVTWATHEHLIDYDEVLEVLPLIQYGDVGLHRDIGYLSNVAIPGFMKHAWLHTEDGIEKPQIVEAISEGVVKRNAIYPIFSDYTIILSPKEVTDKERGGACIKANQIVGVKYDVNFKFDIEAELKYYTGRDTEGATRDLKQAETYIKHYDAAFSCTEVVSYSWWHKREQLRLFRKKARGKEVILADDFINGGWEIKWMSRSVTPDAARKLKLHEEGIGMIEEYRSRHP